MNINGLPEYNPHFIYKSELPNQYLYYIGDDQFSPDRTKAVKFSTKQMAEIVAQAKMCKIMKITW